MSGLQNSPFWDWLIVSWLLQGLVWGKSVALLRCVMDRLIPVD